MASKKHQTSVATEFTKLSNSLKVGHHKAGPTMSIEAMDLFAFDLEQRHVLAEARDFVSGMQMKDSANTATARKPRKKKNAHRPKAEVVVAKTTGFTAMQLQIAERIAKQQNAAKKTQ